MSRTRAHTHYHSLTQPLSIHRAFLTRTKSPVEFIRALLANRACIPSQRHALITRRPLRCRRTPASIFLPKSYKRNDYSPVGVRRAQSCLTLRPWQPVCPSPHHLLRLRHLWGRGVWGRGRLIMHSPISICGELRRCRRVMIITATHLGLRRDMNIHYSQRPGEEREKPTQSASGSSDSVPNTQTDALSNLTSPKASLFSSPSPISPMLCFAFLPLCNVNLDHTPAHTTKASNLPCHQVQPTRYNQ
jgi:hypothetical protein